MVDGYDVVSYFDGKPKKGKKKFTTKHNGVSYKFTTQENLDKFKANPVAFVPQYGGYCAYAVAEKKNKMEADAESYEIRDGKLYLFYNGWFSNKLLDWQKGNTAELQKKGDTNWETLKFKKK